mgnify:CR=1 FL=1
MAKLKQPTSRFVCSECGAVAPKWLGKCPSCNNWNTFNEEAEAPQSKYDVAKPAFSGKSKLQSLEEIGETEGESLRQNSGGSFVLVLAGKEPVVRAFGSEEIPVRALLDDLPGAREDSFWSKLRDNIRNFNEVKQIETPRGLQATLRPYQTQGISYLNFLNEYGFGGILLCQWLLFFFYVLIHRVSFEVETLAFFLCTMGMAPGQIIPTNQMNIRVGGKIVVRAPDTIHQ